jgi:hypothetical protein
LVSMVDERQRSYITAYARLSLAILMLIDFAESLLLSFSLLLQFVHIVLHEIAACSLGLRAYRLASGESWIGRPCHIFGYGRVFRIVVESMSLSENEVGGSEGIFVTVVKLFFLIKAQVAAFLLFYPR